MGKRMKPKTIKIRISKKKSGRKSSKIRKE
jgi:hypothetical protein